MNKEETIAARRAVLNGLLAGGIDGYGFANCPGIKLHTAKNNPRDFRVFGIEGKQPRGSCFHSNCREQVEAFNDRLATELVINNAHFWPWEDEEQGTGIKRRRRVPANVEAIQKVQEASPVEINVEWLKRSSPVPLRGVTVHAFLEHLYPEPQDRVLIFKDEASQGQLVWSGGLDPSWENSFRQNQKGVWFMVQPVTGQFATLTRLRTPYNPTGRTRRAAECVTSFRYIVLESDNVDQESWVKVLASLPMPIVSVTSSGSRSLHALVWVGAKNQMEWEAYRYDIEGAVSTLGCDPAALKAVQLSRLPGCFRHGKYNKDSDTFEVYPDGPRLQELLYLNPNARGTATLWEQHQH